MIKSAKEVRNALSARVKHNCFAFHPTSSGGRCGVCSSMICDSQPKCPFYKTQEQLENQRSASAIRLLAMGENEETSDKLTHILDTYGLSVQQLKKDAEAPIRRKQEPNA